MNALTRIANHLKVSTTQIKRHEEWATIWFVVVQGLGARFVSKKVVMEPTTERDNLIATLVKSLDNKSGKVEGDYETLSRLIRKYGKVKGMGMHLEIEGMMVQDKNHFFSVRTTKAFNEGLKKMVATKWSDVGLSGFLDLCD